MYLICDNMEEFNAINSMIEIGLGIPNEYWVKYAEPRLCKNGRVLIEIADCAMPYITKEISERLVSTYDVSILDVIDEED